MVTATTGIPVDEIAAQARQVRFGRTLVTILAGFFYLTGWLAAFAWVALVFCVLSVRYGWRAGHELAMTKILPEQPAGGAQQLLRQQSKL